LDGGVRGACSSDAPYGDPDPWATIRAARDRTTERGTVVGAKERVPAATVFASLLTDPRDAGRVSRRVAEGMVADLMLLRVGPERALADPDASLVRHTFCAGEVVR
jgi:predicted amidohydrolase YtcJ